MLLILSFIIFLLLISTFFTFSYIKIKNNLTTEHFSQHIPKIIHQTAPKDKNKWKKQWLDCHKTWKEIFPEPEYKHIMWTDEDLDNFMKTEAPSFYPIYQNYKENIKRIDIARYFILQKYGGIYADMDYMVYKNFYNSLPQDKVSISKSPYPGEFMQNALMISPQNHPFWEKVINKAKERKNWKSTLKATGPNLISDTYTPEDVNALPTDTYNPPKDVFNKNLITKHFGTCSWC